MRRIAGGLLLMGAAGFTLWRSGPGDDAAKPSPAPDTRPAPGPMPPCPGPGPCPHPTPHTPKPRPKPGPWENGGGPVGPIGKISLGGPVAPDGTTEVQVDMPLSQRIKNIGSKVDGAGMCVMSSIEMAGRWQNLETMRGLRDWCAAQPGGGYPSKVDKQLKEYCTAKGIACPDYVQYEGNDPAILELALKTARLPAITYSGNDKVRYSGTIAHMVTLSHFDKSWACILDNNGKSPNGAGEDELLWMTPAEFLQRWKSGGGGWAFIWLAPAPPPVPKNK